MKNTFEVIVGNIGTVHTGYNKANALKEYRECVALSNMGQGRIGNEGVTLFCNGEISQEYIGENNDN